MATDKPDLEALKLALTKAKEVHRDAVRVILDAKRAADRAHWHVTEARRAYTAARRPDSQPRPKRSVPRKVESVFPEDE